ncbi:MAG: CehA/McbA family metallohydrolase [Thermodesulfobacteriota bacterium]
MFDYEYIGNLHVHSSHSDGSLSPPEIAGAALGAGLDFLGLNDHDFMTEDLRLEEEGFYGKLLLFKGLEVGKRFHHYLAYDLKSMVRSDNAGPQEVINEVNAQGGFGFMAHPFEKGMPFAEKSLAYTWNDLSVRDFAGMEIWNYSSRWKERIKGPLWGLYCLALKRLTLRRPSRQTLAFWDRLCRKRRVVGIGGSDAHGAGFRWGPFRFRPLSYPFLLSTINTHIFLNQPMPRSFEKAKLAVYQAIREGRLFIAHDGLAPARGFRFVFLSDDGSDLMMGEEAPFNPGGLVIELPSEGEIRLIRNGRIKALLEGKEALFRVKEKGVYRVEADLKIRFLGRYPWIYSNPIYLR